MVARANQFRTEVRSLGFTEVDNNVRDQDILELAQLLRAAGFAETAERLEDAYDLETMILALTIAEREQIIRALDEPPEGLAELRTVLLREHEGRVREGLV